MKTKLLAGLLLAGSAAFAGGNVSIGVSIGNGPGYGYAQSYAYRPPPAPAPRVVYARPPMPAPGYYWVDGYYYPQGKHYRWRNGYWARPEHGRNRWEAPRYNNGRYYNGY